MDDDAERRRERRSVTAIFQGGLVIAVASMTAGLVAKMVDRDMSSPPLDLARIARSPLGDQLMALGIVCLALTPAVNVLALLLVWARQRQPRLVGIALSVALTLTMAVVLGEG